MTGVWDEPASGLDHEAKKNEQANGGVFQVQFLDQPSLVIA